MAGPSGKIASTFPVNYEDVPSAKTFPGKELPTVQTANQTPAVAQGRGSRQALVTYEEGIYVGYRYYETFNVKPSFEFGYGLSYTSFGYSNLKLSSTKFSGSITVSVDIMNTGTKAGREVVELYLTAPAATIDKPSIELKGFAKTRLLQPEETQTMTFKLDGRSLASFNPAVSSWIAEAGKYEVKVGASSRDIKLSTSF
jgi:beta-glucosidase